MTGSLGPQPGMSDAGPRPTAGDLLGLAFGLAGGAASVTMMFLAMRAVMAVGGSCAEGGPYEIATPCPDGAPAAMVLGIFALMGSWVVAARFGPRVGGIWAAAPVFGWTGLFVALGWNFLEAGFSAERGVDVVGLLLGAMFWVMGLVPLAFVLLGGGSGAARLSGGAGMAPGGRPKMSQGLGLPLSVRRLQGSDPSAAARTQELISQLEHLADLKAGGLLDEEEYAAAKAAIVRALGETE